MSVSPGFDTGIRVGKWLRGLQRGVIGVRKSWRDYRQQCWSRLATSVHCTGSSKNKIEDGPTAEVDGLGQRPRRTGAAGAKMTGKSCTGVRVYACMGV